MSHASLKRDWATYYQAVAGRPPRETLLKALALFEETTAIAPRFAIDLGCGNGRDTFELLQRGWRVLAIDGEAAAIASLRQQLTNDSVHLETRVQRFEALELPPADLVNASFCLPFCPPAAFPHLWQTIVNAVQPGGKFCGHLFGDRDSWASDPNMTHHTRQHLETLLQPFQVESLDEEAQFGKTAIGDEKYWHIFHIVAKKI